jgi:hypothetical protein
VIQKSPNFLITGVTDRFGAEGLKSLEMSEIGSLGTLGKAA